MLTPVGHLRSQAVWCEAVSTTVYHPVDGCYEIRDNSPYYVGLLNDEYSVYVGNDKGDDYNIVLDKLITPETYDVGVKYERDTCGDPPWDMNVIFLIPVLKRKETMQW